ncbi:hypothetical protein HN682_07495 [Candidatus Peregrinibacteria bacterium]|jgi:hypothetical protein|nr:hypothetical protein [Candidatus Peregrinibacteria bacterium]
MSYDTNRTWLYRIVGRNIHLWQYIDGANTDTLAGHRIRLPDSYYGSQLIYPDESITNGLRFEGTAFIEAFVTADPNELDGSDNPTLTGVSSPDETSHVNLSRMLSLAVVDYLKAMLSEQQGNLEVKEYYMKQFWKKVGDNESNKRKTSMSFPSSPYAIR